MKGDKSGLIKIILCVFLALGLLAVIYAGVSSAGAGNEYSSYDEDDLEDYQYTVRQK